MVGLIQENTEVVRTVERGGSSGLVDRMARKSTYGFVNRLETGNNFGDDDKRICLKLAEYIQRDSIDEFLLASSANHTVKGIMDSARILDIADLVTHNSGRKTTFLLMANLFNRADEIGERAMKVSHEGDGDDLVAKLVLGQYTNAGGEQKNISIDGAYKSIKNFAHSQGIETEDWDVLFTKIVQSQVDSIKRLSDKDNLDERGEYYSVAEALNYKQGTIGNYAKLLGRIIYGDNGRRIQFFVKEMLERQSRDDLFDVVQDHDIQLNPFVAMLNESHLLEDFKKFASLDEFGPLKFIVKLMLVRPNSFAFFGSTNIFAMFVEYQHPELKERIREIKDGYLSGLE